MSTVNDTVETLSSGNGARHIDPQELEFQRMKTAIHEELVESLDLSMLGEISEPQLRQEIQRLAEELCRHRRKSLADIDQRRMLDELVSEVFGLGPLEPLMADDAVSDILVNGAHEVYVERYGLLELTNVIFADDQHLMRIIQRIVSRVGRRIDETSPTVDARLADGSRVHAVVPPLALGGPKLSIRRFGKGMLKIENLIGNGTLTPQMADFLTAAVRARISFLISGGTGAGKTTLLDALSAFIPHDERLVTIEDAAELILMHPHVVRLETRNANTEGEGEVNQRELVRNSLRMRPDRILVGEVRGAEALDMLQAMNTGHEGALTTIHANDTRDALQRLEMMVAMTGYALPIDVVRQYICAGIKLVVHVSRLKGGARRVTRISEIVGSDGGAYQLKDVFGFEQTGLDKRNAAVGHFYATGHVPQCSSRLAAAGADLPEALFEEADIALDQQPERGIEQPENGGDV
ncbi:MAG: CpaF family protein [Planctomycetota bacterium]|nr:CpaF family protein [Planctomycetota bacterium]